MRFTPGQLLVEGELCELLGVSRASLRPALRVLESEGLIETKNGRGILVTTLDARTASQLYEVRAGLEGLLAHLFVERAHDDDFDELDAIIEEITTSHEQAKPNNELLSLTDRIYELMLRRVDNEVLERFLRIVHSRIPQLRVSTVNHPGRGADSVAEFEAFVAAAKTRDADAAEAAMTQHVRNAAKVAATVLQGDQPFNPSGATDASD